jgi:Tfp pilus assembly protein PilV
VSGRPARRRHDRGTTLIEILISVAVVLVGMLALFQTLGTSVTGSSTASKLSQAQHRAVMVMENIRVAPQAALDCLRTTDASSWKDCETVCRATWPTATMDACVYSTFARANTGLQYDTDQSTQAYFLVYKNAAKPPKKPEGGVSKVTTAGAGGRVYDAQVVIGWNDNNDGTTDSPDHFVVLRSGVFE